MQITPSLIFFVHTTKSWTQHLPRQDCTLTLNTDKGQRQTKWKDRRDTLPKINLDIGKNTTYIATIFCVFEFWTWTYKLQQKRGRQNIGVQTNNRNRHRTTRSKNSFGRERTMFIIVRTVTIHLKSHRILNNDTASQLMEIIDQKNCQASQNQDDQQQKDNKTRQKQEQRSHR